MRYAWLLVMLLAGTARAGGYCTCGEPVVYVQQKISGVITGTQYADANAEAVLEWSVTRTACVVGDDAVMRERWETLNGMGGDWQRSRCGTCLEAHWHRHWWYVGGIRLWCAAGHSWFVEDKGAPPKAKPKDPYWGNAILLPTYPYGATLYMPSGATGMMKLVIEDRPETGKE
jgi:hypothetical protein